MNQARTFCNALHSPCLQNSASWYQALPCCSTTKHCLGFVEAQLMSTQWFGGPRVIQNSSLACTPPLSISCQGHGPRDVDILPVATASW